MSAATFILCALAAKAADAVPEPELPPATPPPTLTNVMSGQIPFEIPMDILAVIAGVLMYFLTAVFLLLVLVMMFRNEIFGALLSFVDALVAGVLRGPLMCSSIVNLLKEPPLAKAIATTVASVLKDETARDEISAVVVSVLRENGPVRNEIASIVRDVLNDPSVEHKIASTVGGVLNKDEVAEGIVDVIKGTGIKGIGDVLNEVNQRVPGFISRRFVNPPSSEEPSTTRPRAPQEVD